MNRRFFLSGLAKTICLGSALGLTLSRAQAVAPLSREKSIAAWNRRIQGILRRGRLPIIDVQATYVAGKTNLSRMMRYMDDLDVAQIAFAAAHAPNSSPSLALHRDHPAYFIPCTNSGEFPRWWRRPERFVAGVRRELETESYYLMGEHEFRHLPSPEQVQAGRTDRDITVDLTGPAGQALFRLSAETGVAFQIHYEIEDALLPPLETMLERHPGARVIWCHLAMIRRPDRAKHYNAEYVGSLIERFPGIHFDLAVPKAEHIYRPTGARDSTLFEATGEVNEEWQALIERYPDRFLAASDYRPAVERQYPGSIGRQREILSRLSADARTLVAYGNAWRLLTGSPWNG